jgi:AmmeMemoRadiSam system protein A
MQSPDRHDLPGADLLRLARNSIDYGLDHDKPVPVDLDGLPVDLIQPAATFTTLRLDEKLRGCCGTLEAAHPLATDVARSAFQAAFRDLRFQPLARDEFGRIRLEVSVLSPLEVITVTDEADLLNRLAPGTDGLVIVEGARRATFLPKVWESLPDPSQFLAALKIKCGLPEDYWSERLEFFRYRTSLYAEPTDRVGAQSESVPSTM